jgi:Fe-S-cluster containining protein
MEVKKENVIACRLGCGACCVVISISSPIPGMPQGKKAGERCVQLTDDNKCKLFGSPERPKVCLSLKPSQEMCGPDNAHAYTYLKALEEMTEPKI